MAESSSAPATKPVVMFKKAGRTRPQKSSRKRSSSPVAEEEAAAETTIVRPKSRSIANPLVQGSKRRRTEGETGGLDEYDYAADDAALTRADEFATRDSNWDLETLEKEKGIMVNEDGDIVQADDGIYRGQKGYLPTINKRGDSRDSKMKAGPIRATANIRTITLVDYQPDICTPYKNTGFCGYGDSCKFLHDRGDYLAGWQLDQLDPADPEVQEVEEEEEMLPFACIKCQKEFKDPVVTKCGHYFCMQCALDYYKKKNKCYACGARTDGIFTPAEKLLRKLKAKQERKRAEKDTYDKEGGSGIEIGGSDEEGEGEGHEGAVTEDDDE